MSIVDSEELFSGTKAVELRYQLNEVALAAWLTNNVTGYKGPLTIAQFRGGQSNPTYKLITPRTSYVLRRKPPGTLLPSAHAVDREYCVISRLGDIGFPVPRTYGFCDDTSVVGSSFYVMSMEEGRVFWDGKLPKLNRSDRVAVYRSEIETLADLHLLDPEKIGLGDFGRPGNYCGRQIDRWIKQYRASQTRHIEEMEKLIEWLPRTLPAQNSRTVVHGDYRLNNVIFDPVLPKVKAVLDWELATIGDPIADFTNLLVSWALPYDGRAMLAGIDFAEQGIPTMKAAIELYRARTGLSTVENVDWYLAYNLFRLAAIMQGIAGRYRDGTASSPRAKDEGDQAVPLAGSAWHFARLAGA
jgi:aminoglycoside phosphotransferase (APT) family kinase protein